MVSPPVTGSVNNLNKHCKDIGAVDWSVRDWYFKAEEMASVMCGIGQYTGSGCGAAA